MNRIDLHLHSSHSDGYFSLKTLFKMASSANLDLFSITDHDTISSQKEAIKLAKEHQINYVTGVEISCQFYSQTIHIVGLAVDCKNKTLNQTLEHLKVIRKQRALKIAEKIELNTNLKEPMQLLGRDDSQSYCRLHFAELLVDYHYAKDSRNAFDQYLKEGAPCYESANWIEMKEAIAVINQSGGRAVLAHPLKYKMSSSKLKLLFKEFRDFGGFAVEIINGRDRKPQNIRKISNLANFFGLVASCGSDFHHRFSQPIGVDLKLLSDKNTTTKRMVWDYL